MLVGIFPSFCITEKYKGGPTWFLQLLTFDYVYIHCIQRN